MYAYDTVTKIWVRIPTNNPPLPRKGHTLTVVTGINSGLRQHTSDVGGDVGGEIGSNGSSSIRNQIKKSVTIKADSNRNSNRNTSNDAYNNDDDADGDGDGDGDDDEEEEYILLFGGYSNATTSVSNSVHICRARDIELYMRKITDKATGMT